MSFYTAEDVMRMGPVRTHRDLHVETYRSEFRRDYARVVHCAAFRRLQGKTQLFPGVESDFFRNRLTHSIEVAQIAKSIAIRLNHLEGIDIDTDLVEFAGLAHDLGHPPFGHTGERALNECMSDHGGFEGNAQTLRIIAKLEKKVLVTEDFEGRHLIHKYHNERAGLNLTFRALASVLKYDREIPKKSSSKIKDKGYYAEERLLVEKIKEHVAGDYQYDKFKTIECQIMDIADDIAYATSDLEDALMAGFVTPLDMVTKEPTLLENVAGELTGALNGTYTASKILGILEELFVEFIFDRNWYLGEGLFGTDIENGMENNRIKDTSIAYRASRLLASNSYYRTRLISYLVGLFVRGVKIKVNVDCPALSELEIAPRILEKIEVLKHFNYHSQILSPRLKVVEFNGKRVIEDLFKIFNSDEGANLLPVETRDLYRAVKKHERHRVICDTIAGMTDRYAFEMYSRLTGDNSQTLFKPFTS